MCFYVFMNKQEMQWRYFFFPIPYESVRFYQTLYIWIYKQWKYWRLSWSSEFLLFFTPSQNELWWSHWMVYEQCGNVDRLSSDSNRIGNHREWPNSCFSTQYFPFYSWEFGLIWAVNSGCSILIACIFILYSKSQSPLKIEIGGAREQKCTAVPKDSFLTLLRQ